MEKIDEDRLRSIENDEDRIRRIIAFVQSKDQNRLVTRSIACDTFRKRHDERGPSISEFAVCHILADYEPSFKVLAAELLDLLLSCRTFFQDVILHHGASVLLSLLHSDDPHLPLPLLRAIERLAADPACAKEPARAPQPTETSQSNAIPPPAE